MTYTTFSKGKTPNLIKPSKRSGILYMLQNIVKRSIDVIGALVGLVVLSPLFLAIVVVLKRESSGSVFYWGDRIGRFGKPFKICKFRTMSECMLDVSQHKITAEDDPRITVVGKILRDSKLNELPQLWNVLIGEMSLVGPRPEDPLFVEQWPQYKADIVLSVRPGITSPASVIYRDEEKLLKSDNVIEGYLSKIVPSKLRLDVLYVRHRTLLTDVDVLFWTLAVLLPRMKERSVSERLLLWGPANRFFSRYFSWFIYDYVAALLSVSLAGAIWRLSAPLEIGILQSAASAFTIALLFSGINYVLGLHRVWWSRAHARRGVELLLSCIIATLSLSAANSWLIKKLLFPPGMLILTGVFAFASFITIRYRTRLLTGLVSRWTTIRATPESVGERLLIVGAGRAGEMVSWLMTTDISSELFSIVGYVDDDPQKQGLDINHIPVLGTTNEISQLVQAYDIGAIAFAIRDADKHDRDRILKICQKLELPLIMVPSVLDSIHTHLKLDITNKKQVGLMNTPIQTVLREIDKLIQLGDLQAARLRIHEYQQIAVENV